ncbi:hypothetical protein AFCA_008265 [Aspergillus flavus]|nr:hypothetical protein AFCA_008265 [Aspergillus flavus]
MESSGEIKEYDASEDSHQDAEIDRLVDDFLQNQTTSVSERLGDIIFKDLSVIGAGAGHQRMHDVPKTLQRLSKLANPATWSSRKPPPCRAILQRLTGTIRQGEMLMVVGRPGSGCTTVLKALANIREEYLAMEGDVWYGSMDAGTAKQARANQVAFVGKRAPASSMQARTVLKRFIDMLQERTISIFQHYLRSTSDPDRAQHLQQDLQTVLELMGLAQAAHVRIGSDHIRGVSGGQRRRVSLAEALCTRAR